MVKVTLITNNPREEEIVNENMTVREFLERHNANYGNASTMLDGVPLKTEGLDASFEEHKVKDRCIVSCLTNKDSGAQAVIAGSSCIVKSDLTPAEIKKVKKMHPEALVLYDGENPIFAIDIDETQPGSINSVGACFGNAASVDGKATVTILISPDIEDPVKEVEEQLGRPLMMLKNLERNLREILPELENEERELRSMIVRI